MTRIWVTVGFLAVLATGCVPSYGQWAPIMETRIKPAPGSPRCGNIELEISICPLLDFAEAEMMLECTRNMSFDGPEHRPVHLERGDTTWLTVAVSLPSDDTARLAVTVWVEFAEGMGASRGHSEKGITFITTGDRLETVGGGPPLRLEGLDDLSPSEPPRFETPKVKTYPGPEEPRPGARRPEDLSQVSPEEPALECVSLGSVDTARGGPQRFVPSRRLIDSIEALPPGAMVEVCMNLREREDFDLAAPLVGSFVSLRDTRWYQDTIPESIVDSLRHHRIPVIYRALDPYFQVGADGRADWHYPSDRSLPTR